MSLYVVMLVYAAAILAAGVLLLWFHRCSWYWHVFSVALALMVGLAPPPAGYEGPAFDLVVGALLMFLMAWGIGGLAFYRVHHTRHA
jgi:hypothetical protein